MSHNRAVNLFQESGEFFPTQHDRHLVRHPRPRHLLDWPDVELEYLLVQKQHRAQRLVLRRRADFLVNGEPREKRHKLRCTHGGRVLLSMKEDVPSNPGDVGLFGTPTVVPQTNRGAHAVEELRRRHSLWRVLALDLWEAFSHTLVVASVANTVPKGGFMRAPP